MKKSLAIAASLLLGSSVALAAKPAFEELDANGDGMISSEEAGDMQGFAEADGNGDGMLTVEEYETVAE